MTISRKAFSIALTIHKEPESYAQAFLDPRWQDAMQAEIEALQANNTWVMTSLPHGKAPICCKWGFLKLILRQMGLLRDIKPG